METVTYEDAVVRCSSIIDQQHIYGVDIFGCSTALAIVFSKPKNQTLDDLTNYRIRVKGIRPRGHPV